MFIFDELAYAFESVKYLICAYYYSNVHMSYCSYHSLVLTNVHGFCDLIITDLSLIFIITLIKINQKVVVYSIQV